MEVVKNLIRTKFMPNNPYCPYNDRESRSKFIAKTFKKYIESPLLDVGSSENFLKNYIPNNIKYVSVDITGTPTYKIDLEKEGLSHFKDNSFNTVICTEVLEHLNNLHDVFDDICRVSNKYVILSLPNNWLYFKFMLIKSKGDLKFYGLPVEKPIDRHKWFFNYDQALNFIIKRGKMNRFKYILHIPIPFIRFGFRHHIFNMLFKYYYKDQFGINNTNYTNVWVLLEREQASNL